MEGEAENVRRHWPLYAETMQIGRQLAIYECLKMVRRIPGHIVEIGCHKGANLLFMAKVLRLFSPETNKKVIGFESGRGLEDFVPADGTRQDKGAYAWDAGDDEIIMQAAAKYNCSVALVVGDVKDTLRIYLNARQYECFSMVYLDADLYTPTMEALQRLWPLLSPGGVMVFDEGCDSAHPGEGIAFRRFVEECKPRYEAGCFDFANQPDMWVRKLP